MPSMKFIPDWLKNVFRFDSTFYTRNSYFIGQKGPVWIDTLKPYELYNSIPQLNLVINRRASMFSNMDLKLMNVKNGEEVESPELQKLLQNPNPLQSMNKWLTQYEMQKCVYGNQFMYKNVVKTKFLEYPVGLTNISPYYIQPILTGKLFDQVRIEDIISGYDYVQEGDKRKFDTKDILYTRVDDLDNPIIGHSPIVAIKFPLTNTKLAYEYRNILMAERGAIGMITNKTKDSIGNKVLKPEEKKELEDQYINNYGINKGQSRIHISGSDLDWKPFGYPTKDLLLFEEVDANFLTIVDHYGLNVNIFSSKNATFENVKQAIIQVYQDTIQPEADLFTQALGKFLGIPEGTRLIASYEHLSIMKENKAKGMNAIEMMVSALTQAVAGGILTKAQANAILKTELATQLGEV